MSSDWHAKRTYNISDIPDYVRRNIIDKPIDRLTHTELRFWTKTRYNAETGCVEWDTPSTDRHGYGQFNLDGTKRAHRVAIFLTDDDIHCLDDIPGEDLMHSCDNPKCCAPQHLTPGSHRENIIEGVQRTREDRLTDEEVREIRERAAAGETYTDLAEEFGRHRTNIGSIVRRESFEWVD